MRQIYLRTFLATITCVIALHWAILQPLRLYGDGFKRFYAAHSVWNTPMAEHATTDPNSSQDLAVSIFPWAAKFVFSNGAFGVPLAYASAKDKVYSVTCTGDENQCNGRKTLSFPIPKGSKPADGSDHHLSVVYPARDGSPFAGKELDIWEAHYDAAADSWSGQGMNIVDLYGSGTCQPTRIQRAQRQSCGTSTASGFAALAGVVRPEEIRQGHIDHVLAIATPAVRSDYAACPATRTDGKHGPPALPEGARVQLDPSFDVARQNWPQWVKIIAVALQKYGAISVDYADVPIVKGVTDQNAGVPSWASVGVPIDEYNNLAVIPWQRLRVITHRRCR